MTAMPTPTTPALASATPSFDYLPGLDGLRALAVLLVLFSHLSVSPLIPGGFGVSVFFFISGLLITRLLLAEHQANGAIAIGRFYLRRMIRLYPALLLAVLLGTLVFWLAVGILNWNRILAALLYYSNYYDIYGHFSQPHEGFEPLVILWSLAVEEQFYLLFPLLCVLMLRGHDNLRRFFWVVAALLAAALLWRIVLVHGGANSIRIYKGSDTRMDAILYGAWLTLILARDTQNKWRRFCASHLVQGVCLLILLLCFVVRADSFRDTMRYTLQGLALMPLVTAICFGTSLLPLTRLLESKPLRRVGNWSYSLYLYHPVAIVCAEIYWGPGSIGPHRLGWKDFTGFALTSVLLSFALATASYYGVEQPLLRWRRRFGAHVVAN